MLATSISLSVSSIGYSALLSGRVIPPSPSFPLFLPFPSFQALVFPSSLSLNPPIQLDGAVPQPPNSLYCISIVKGTYFTHAGKVLIGGLNSANPA